MRSKYLCTLPVGLVLALVTVGCRAPRPEPEPASATRAEVAEALYRQLSLVLARHDKLVKSESAAAQNEQEILVELATEIALRIVRIDPHARLDHTSNRRSGG